MSSETIWKNSKLNDSKKEPMTNKLAEPSDKNTPPFLPDSLMSKPSSVRRIKKKVENVKKIPLFEDLYDPFMLDTNNYEGATLSSGVLQEGMNKYTGELSDSDKALIADGSRLKRGAKNLANNAANNIQAASDKKTEILQMLKDKSKAEINLLKDELFKIKDVMKSFSGDITAQPPVIAPIDFTLKTKNNTATANRETKATINRAQFIVKLLLSKILKMFKLGSAKFKEQLIHWHYRYRQFVVKSAQAMTQNNASSIEIDVFSDQITKMATVLLSWVILYNWYYLMFFLEPREQYKLNLNYYKENYSLIYAFLGIPLRGAEMLDYLLLEVIPKYTKMVIKSNIVIFFMMAIIFIGLVNGGMAQTITTDFFNSVNGSYTGTVFSGFVFGLIIVYGILFWIGDFVMIPPIPGVTPIPLPLPVPKWYMQSIWLFVPWLISGIIFLITVMILGTPIGVFAICSLIFFYSFFAIIMYNGFNLSSTFTAISESISHISDLNAEDDSGKCENVEKSWFMYIKDYLRYGVKYFYIFMFELFILYILISGLVTYTTGFTVPFPEKATFKNVNSMGAAVKTAFTHLYTWLIIINILLILLLVIVIRYKYKKIHATLDMRNVNVEKLNPDAALHG
jgi:hypothetical protein